jgi:hypothetical protein
LLPVLGLYADEFTPDDVAVLWLGWQSLLLPRTIVHRPTVWRFVLSFRQERPTARHAFAPEFSETFAVTERCGVSVGEQPWRMINPPKKKQLFMSLDHTNLLVAVETGDVSRVSAAISIADTVNFVDAVRGFATVCGNMSTLNVAAVLFHRSVWMDAFEESSTGWEPASYGSIVGCRGKTEYGGGRQGKNRA